MPEIQYLAYLHNAEDQLRGEAATLQFFSQGQYRNGMVVRIAGYGYQKGFGGHFHNDNAVGVLRDIPGLVIASPARPDDASAMLADVPRDGARRRQRLRLPRADRALPHARPLRGGRRAVARARRRRATSPLGSARTYGDGDDLTIVTWANGLRMSLRVARALEAHGIARARRRPALARAAAGRGHPARGERDRPRARRRRDAPHGRRLGGDHRGARRREASTARLARVASTDSFIPLGDAANLVLVSEQDVERAALELVGERV